MDWEAAGGVMAELFDQQIARLREMSQELTTRLPRVSTGSVAIPYVRITITPAEADALAELLRRWDAQQVLLTDLRGHLGMARSVAAVMRACADHEQTAS